MDFTGESSAGRVVATAKSVFQRSDSVASTAFAIALPPREGWEGAGAFRHLPDRGGHRVKRGEYERKQLSGPKKIDFFIQSIAD